jgi:hypothetical protein
MRKDRFGKASLKLSQSVFERERQHGQAAAMAGGRKVA